MTTRRLLAAVCLLLVAAPALAAPRASGDRPASPAARQALVRGLAAFRAGHYADAIAAFRDGYAIEPHPALLYARGQAERLAGDCPAAILTYAAFLATSPTERRALPARINLARCREEVAAHAASPPADHATASLSVAPLPPPLPAPVEHEPPPVEVTPLPSPVEAHAVEPPVKRAVAPAPPPRTIAPLRRRFAIAAAASGLALAIAGATLVAVGELRIAEANGATTYEQFVARHAEAADAGSLRLVGAVLLPVGVAALAAGVTLFVLDRRARADAARWSLAPSLAPGSAGLVAAGRF